MSDVLDQSIARVGRDVLKRATAVEWKHEWSDENDENGDDCGPIYLTLNRRERVALAPPGLSEWHPYSFAVALARALRVPLHAC